MLKISHEPEECQAGQLIPIGLMADKHSTVMPDIPTMKEAGLAEIEKWRKIVTAAGAQVD